MTSASIIRLACVAAVGVLLSACSSEPETTSTTTTSRTSTVEPAVPATHSTTTTVSQ